MRSESRRRRGTAATAIAVVFSVALSVRTDRQAQAAAPPNVLVVCIDALRADRLGVYGATPSPSPAIDALAASGMTFTDATSVASWTKPSVPSILTGLYPGEHGVFDNRGSESDVLPAEHPTLAQMLQQRGYRTAAFVENDQLRRGHSGLDRGFSLYVDEAGRPAEIVDRFLTWSTREKGVPWFAYLHIFDPHYPYEPEDTLFEDAEAGRLRVRIAHWDLRGEFWWLLRERVNGKTTRFDPAALADLDRLYRLEIREVDAVIGRMLSSLAADTVLDHTIVVVTSDHGEGFLERGRIDHGYGPYRELLHIPLIVRLPKRDRAGTRSPVLAQNVDIAATILDALGLPVPAAWSSRSLLALLRGAPPPRPVALAQERHGRSRQVAARDARYSYVRSELAPEKPRGRAFVPPSATAGTRVRAQGVFDGGRLVAGSVKRIAPGDLDIEVDGPVESIDMASRSARVLGTTVVIAGGVPDGAGGIVTLTSLGIGQHLRAHGRVEHGVFVPTKIERGVFVSTKIERAEPHSIEMEGVVKSIAMLENGDAVIDLGGISFLVDPKARWSNFPDGNDAPQVGGTSGDVRVVEELFDRTSDPAELLNVANSRPVELERMRRLAEEAQGSLQRPSKAGRAAIDEGMRERLRALGYLE